jgi:hypothetical protein
MDVIRMLWIVSMILIADGSVCRTFDRCRRRFPVTYFPRNLLNRVRQTLQDRSGSPSDSVLSGGLNRENKDKKSRENHSRVHDGTSFEPV